MKAVSGVTETNDDVVSADKEKCMYILYNAIKWRIEEAALGGSS